MALSKIQAESVNLADDFAFTGTVTGAGLTSPFANTVAVTSEGGAVTTNLAQGSAKAWVNFNGTSTIASRDSKGVSGLLDNGTGNYTVSFTSNMSGGDYSASVSSSSGGVSNTDTMVNPYTWAVSSVSMSTNTNSGSLTDRVYVNLTIHGDLA